MARKGRVFTRTLGMAPCCGKPKGSTTEQLGWFFDAFGLPEIKTHKKQKTIFWNFKRDNGSEVFSLTCDVSWLRKTDVNLGLGLYEVDVELFAGPGLLSFREWTAIRLDAVQRGKVRAATPCDPRFVIERVR
jgi:hypothetical protein